MDKLIINLLRVQNQLKILHWQTHSFAAHKALGNAYDDLGESIDELVEVYQGKYGRVTYEAPVEFGLVNSDEIDIEDILAQLADYLTGPVNEIFEPANDSECLNIRDEILATVNKLRYLLTLK